MIRVQDIPRDARAPAAARRLLAELSTQLDASLVADATLLLSEVVANGVRHGCGERLRVVVDAGQQPLRCEVIDAGSGFVPRARTRPADSPGGWGLRLVEDLACAWGVRSGSTHVWFELDVPGRTGR